MPEPPIRRFNLMQFQGLVTNANPHSIPAGAAQIQTNMVCTIAGQLSVRQGMRPALFGNSVTATTHSVISMIEYVRPESAYVLYEDSNGNIKAGRDVS